MGYMLGLFFSLKQQLESQRRLEQQRKDNEAAAKASLQQAKADRRATKRLAKGQVKIQKQMAYVGSVYTIAPWSRTADDVLDELLRKENQPHRPRPKNKHVWAEMTRYHEGDRWDGQSRLFIALAHESQRRDPDRKLQTICLMDGQRSLWRKRNEWLRSAVGILDIFHATEKLWKAAYCFHPQGSRKAEDFVTHYLRMFLEGKVSYAIGSLRRKGHQVKASKRKDLEDVLRFFRNNACYMKYDEYLAAGYPIGSGVVEGACRHLVRDRMERTGMRWDIQGAQAMLNTRSIFINEAWNDFIEYRVETEQDQLYGQAA